MDKMMEEELADEKLIGFMVSSDFTESNNSWPVLVGLLDSFGCQEQIYGQPWWPIVFWGPCLRWICEWFVWYELWQFLRTSSQVVLESGISTSV